MAIGGDGPAGGVDDAADDADQGGLARPVRSQQGEDLAAPDGEVGGLEGRKAALVGLADPGNGNNRIHALPLKNGPAPDG